MGVGPGWEVFTEEGVAVGGGAGFGSGGAVSTGLFICGGEALAAFGGGRAAAPPFGG